jgi:hypothetical protein
VSDHVDIFVTECKEPSVNEGLALLLHLRLVRAAANVVVRVVSHGWREPQAVVQRVSGAGGTGDDEHPQDHWHIRLGHDTSGDSAVAGERRADTFVAASARKRSVDQKSPGAYTTDQDQRDSICGLHSASSFEVVFLSIFTSKNLEKRDFISGFWTGRSHVAKRLRCVRCSAIICDRHRTRKRRGCRIQRDAALVEQHGCAGVSRVPAEPRRVQQKLVQRRCLSACTALSFCSHALQFPSSPCYTDALANLAILFVFCLCHAPSVLLVSFSALQLF